MDLPPGGPSFRRRGHPVRRRPRRGRRLLAAVLLLVCLAVGALATSRVLGALSAFGNPLAEAARSVDPPTCSVPWKLQHGQRVALLLLGYGG